MKQKCSNKLRRAIRFLVLVLTLQLFPQGLTMRATAVEPRVPNLFPWRGQSHSTANAMFGLERGIGSNPVQALERLAREWPEPSWEEGMLGRFNFLNLDLGSEIPEILREQNALVLQRMQLAFDSDLIAILPTSATRAQWAQTAQRAGSTFESVTRDAADNLIARFWFKRGLEILATHWGFSTRYSLEDATRLAEHLLRNAVVSGVQGYVGADRLAGTHLYDDLKRRVGNRTVVLTPASGWLFLNEQTRHYFGEEAQARITELNNQMRVVLVFEPLPRTYPEFVRAIADQLSVRIAPIARAVTTQRLLMLAGAQYLGARNPFSEAVQAPARAERERTALYEQLKESHFIASQNMRGRAQALSVSGPRAQEVLPIVEALKENERLLLFRTIFGVDHPSALLSVPTQAQIARYEALEKSMRLSFFEKLVAQVQLEKAAELQRGELLLELTPVQTLEGQVSRLARTQEQGAVQSLDLENFLFAPETYDLIFPLRQVPLTNRPQEGFTLQMAIDSVLISNQYRLPTDAGVVSELDQIRIAREQGYVQYLAAKMLLEHVPLRLNPMTQIDDHWPIRNLNSRQALKQLIQVTPMDPNARAWNGALSGPDQVIQIDTSLLNSLIN